MCVAVQLKAFLFHFNPILFDKRMKFHSPDGRSNDKITFSSSYYCWNFLPKQIIMKELSVTSQKVSNQTPNPLMTALCDT